MQRRKTLAVSNRLRILKTLNDFRDRRRRRRMQVIEDEDGFVIMLLGMRVSE